MATARLPESDEDERRHQAVVTCAKALRGYTSSSRRNDRSVHVFGDTLTIREVLTFLTTSRTAASKGTAGTALLGTQGTNILLSTWMGSLSEAEGSAMANRKRGREEAAEGEGEAEGEGGVKSPPAPGDASHAAKRAKEKASPSDGRLARMIAWGTSFLPARLRGRATGDKLPLEIREAMRRFEEEPKRPTEDVWRRSAQLVARLKGIRFMDGGPAVSRIGINVCSNTAVANSTLSGLGEGVRVLIIARIEAGAGVAASDLLCAFPTNDGPIDGVVTTNTKLTEALQMSPAVETNSASCGIPPTTSEAVALYHGQAPLTVIVSVPN